MKFLPFCPPGSNQPCRYQGKTAYLYVKIIESLIAGRPFLYQTRNGTVHLVNDRGVKLIQSRLSPKNAPIVGFVDGDWRTHTHGGRLCTGYCGISTKCHRSKVDRSNKYPPTINDKLFTKLAKLAVDQWWLRELFVAGLVLAPFLSILD